jgi:acyl-CoA thioesterase
MNELTRREIDFAENNNFRKLLGIQVVDVQPGTAVLSLPVREQLLQSSKNVHGGVLAILVDSVIGTAVRSVLEEGATCATAEMNINYIRPAKEGTITSYGKVIHQGRTLVVGTAEIIDGEGNLLACGRATYFTKRKGSA